MPRGVQGRSCLGPSHLGSRPSGGRPPGPPASRCGLGATPWPWFPPHAPRVVLRGARSRVCVCARVSFRVEVVVPREGPWIRTTVRSCARTNPRGGEDSSTAQGE
eukprot:scaffold73_cov337-Pavlova_lutheri.AAC.1